MSKHSPLSLWQARRLLDLDDTKLELTKVQIQQAFIKAAKTHHPDRRFNHDATPCAERFQRALEAKELLLSYYCDKKKRSPFPYRRRRHDGFAPGFPTRKLRVLTLKQNLILRGLVLTTITFGTLYDEWSRKG
jgi:hypothetical protein